MDFEETIAFISFLSDGIGAEKAGRGAASIFSAMSAPTDAAQKAMSDLGVSFDGSRAVQVSARYRKRVQFCTGGIES